MAEDIGNIYKTKIPSYAEAADIQAALKLFHYGTTTVPTEEEDILQDSLAGHLKDLQDQVTLIETVGIGSDFLTIAQIGSLTNPQDGYIAMASDSSGSPITTTYATAIYQNEAPTEDLVDGLVWVDKDSSPRRAYIYNEGSSSWDIIDDIQSVVNNAGDMLYGTSNDTISVLPIGTAGQVLTVNSGATAPEWATASSGGMTLISTTTLTGASVTLSSIPQTYNNLWIIVRDFLPASDGNDLRFRFNNVSTANTYLNNPIYNNITGATTFNNTYGYFTEASDNTTTESLVTATIPDYTNSVTWKMAFVQSITNNETTPTSFRGYFGTTIHNQTTAISSLVIFPQSGNFTSGTVLLYGVK